MKGSRKRQPIDDEYVHALGVATYCFALCEWNAIYCAERIEPGSLRAFRAKKLTAGEIAKKLCNMVRCMPNAKERSVLQIAADRFAEVVELRNSIVHGNPCSNEEGKSRLVGRRRILEIKDLEDAADEFSDCSSALNKQLHGFLASYQPGMNSKRRE